MPDEEPRTHQADTTQDENDGRHFEDRAHGNDGRGKHRKITLRAHVYRQARIAGHSHLELQQPWSDDFISKDGADTDPQRAQEAVRAGVALSVSELSGFNNPPDLPQD